ncbi:SOS response-associated peptidase [Aquimarina algicola]|uniref:Abasic site processing protein n=1 Tax=Aquimarina algicola TaxID=2589995 RepID=A0A504J9A6_9FLAO|nr:SOS response-associated peptidase family protein [Aquimarina algicola]TPN84458.1 SOS response-associated peptidase [Aquimarina algicola]
MYKKLSNIANRKTIEREMGVNFKFPRLYSPSHIIDGEKESTLSIITMDDPDSLSFGIWGLLPDQYEDDWEDFQKVHNTLKVSRKKLEVNKIFQEPFEERRCLIVITGFFIYHLYSGSLYPYYVYSKEEKPFCLAGVYNVLEDGFITVSLITKESNGIIKKIQNLNTDMPVVISKRFYNTWLNNNVDKLELDNIIETSSTENLIAHPIAKEFFKNDILYESMLDPVLYKNIPKV